MRIVQINTVFGRGSTGKIFKKIHEIAISKGYQSVFAYRYAEDDKHIADTYEISTWFDCHIHNRVVKYTHKIGFYSKWRTLKFIRFLKKYKPDIIHLHNLHGSYVNIETLFKYIKKSKVPVVWTLHDCWSFTGYCPYFTLSGCENWRTGCSGCQSYPRNKFGLFDNSNYLWKKKKSWFSGIDNMTLVAPSIWLSGLVGQSYLKDYPIKVINNGIDLSVFKPEASDFRKKYGCEDKYVVLGVAFSWGQRKGLDVFIELSRRLDKEKYQIVLVGTNERVDKMLPDNIISVHKTNNQQELAQLYSMADLFVNPTREEVFGLVNVEANACGTPVLTFNTGGSPECINEFSGSVVECEDVDAMEKEIIRICKMNPYSQKDCIERAKQFDINNSFVNYFELYKQIYGRN